MSTLSSIIDELQALPIEKQLAVLDSLPADDREAIAKMAFALTADMAWVPNPGPQTMAYNSDVDQLLYGGSAGGGKALGFSTPIPTASGWSTMGEIQVGDVLLDEGYRECAVIAVTEAMLDHVCYRVEFSDGSAIVADEDHRWETMSDDGEVKVRTTAEIRTSLRRHRIVMATLTRTITDIVPVESVPVKCIAVDSPSHLYLAGPTMIPTHNTDLGIAKSLQRHKRSLILRRINKEVGYLVQRTEEILGHKTGYNGQDDIWKLPGGRIIQYGGCQHPGDEQAYKGQPKDCVVAGTRVLMADGGYRPIEAVRVGDLVATLSGPRRVTMLHSKVAPAVEAVAKVRGAVVARQVQGQTHSVLTPSGWASYCTEPTSRDAAAASGERLTLTDQSHQVARSWKHSGRQPRRESLPLGLASAQAHGEAGRDGATGRRGLCKSDRPFREQDQFGGRSAISRRSGRRPTAKRSLSSLARLASVGSHEWILSLQRRSNPQRRTSASCVLSSTCGPKECFCGGRCSGSLTESSLTPSTARASSHAGQLLPRQLAQDHADYLCTWGSFVALVAVSLGSVAASAPMSIQAAAGLALCFALLMQTRLALRLASVGSSLLRRARACGDALFGRAPGGFLGYCSFGNDRCGERRLRLGREVYLFCPQQQGDAAERSPRSLQGGGEAHTPECSHALRSYRHPYSSEIHSTDASVCVASLSFAPVGVRELFDLTVEETNHYITDGGFINKNCVVFDEASGFLESQVRYIMTWLRTTEPNQKTQALFPTNPPDGPEGEWIIRWWAPWVDKNHPLYPVPYGKPLWFRERGDEIEWREEPWSWQNDQGTTVRALSRTFIRAFLSDNPEYARTDYASQLEALPEELRRRYSGGEFVTEGKDAEFQVIPSAWVRAAQDRWKPDGRAKPMTSMGCDVARGGPDESTIAKRHGSWVDELIVKPGAETPDGPQLAALVIINRRDSAAICIDTGGGWGGSPLDNLVGNEIKAKGINPSAGSNGTTKDAARLKFRNLRAEMWWRLRESLDPSGDDPMALPKDQKLFADLIAPRWKNTSAGILIESKDDIRKRIGRSPDRGDAVALTTMANNDLVAHARTMSMMGRPGAELPKSAKSGYSTFKDKMRAFRGRR